MHKKNSFFVFVAAAAIAVILRLFTIIALTEYNTGFIKRSCSIASGILFAVFLGMTAFACIYISVSADKPLKPQPSYLSSSLFSVALGVCIAVSVFFGNYTAVPALFRILCIILGALSAAFFFAFALKPIFSFPLPAAVSAIPAAFLIVRTATVFIKSAYHAVTFDTVFEIGSHCLLMMLFLEFARAACGLSQKNSPKKFAALSAAASIFLLSAAVPKMILRLFYPAALNDGLGDSILLFFFALFVLSLLFTKISFSEKEDRKMGVYYVGRH